jgi:RimJ/RimL family protein N-acetyltransferase
MPNIDPARVTVIQPKTPEEVEVLADDILTLYNLDPNADPEFIDNIRDYPQYLSIFYIDDNPAGYINIGDADGYDYLGKDSLQFGGAVAPEYRDTGLTQLVSPTTIRQAFKKSGKRKMLADTDEENKEARMALAALGFKHIGKRPNGRLLYKLDRKDALE